MYLKLWDPAGGSFHLSGPYVSFEVGDATKFRADVAWKELQSIADEAELPTEWTILLPADVRELLFEDWDEELVSGNVLVLGWVAAREEDESRHHVRQHMFVHTEGGYVLDGSGTTIEAVMRV